MKTLIVLALTGVALAYAAKYFKINSWEQVKNLVPDLKSVVPNLKEMILHN
ncbi:MAG: hypothetical protein V4565_13610 [Bacteroidota bacterium]